MNYQMQEKQLYRPSLHEGTVRNLAADPPPLYTQADLTQLLSHTPPTTDRHTHCHSTQREVSYSPLCPNGAHGPAVQPPETCPPSPTQPPYKTPTNARIERRVHTHLSWGEPYCRVATCTLKGHIEGKIGKDTTTQRYLPLLVSSQLWLQHTHSLLHAGQWTGRPPPSVTPGIHD